MVHYMIIPEGIILCGLDRTDAADYTADPRKVSCPSCRARLAALARLGQTLFPDRSSVQAESRHQTERAPGMVTSYLGSRVYFIIQIFDAKLKEWIDWTPHAQLWTTALQADAEAEARRLVQRWPRIQRARVVSVLTKRQIARVIE